MELLIKNVRIVDAFLDFKGDVYIKDGKIGEIGEIIDKKCNTIQGKKYTLLPSFIDMHCHFRDPGFTYKEDLLSGSLAAIKGGYTAVNLMANTKPICSSMNTVDYVLQKAKKINLVDIHQTVSITNNFDGNDISHLDKLDSRVKFISDDGKGVQNSVVMYNAMNKAKKKNICVVSHAEDEDLVKYSTRLSEDVMTARDIILAGYTKTHLHLAHVSTKGSMKEIINGKKQGFNITCEVTPHHIAVVNNIGYKVNPPIRDKEDVEFLINAIKEGWVDVIATDHAPHTKEDKAKGAPGISGLETAFSVCYTSLVKNKNISLNKLSQLMSLNPGKIMGLNKGRINEGYDGDLVLVDLDSKVSIDSEKFYSKGKNTPFNGMEFWGKVICTIKAGKIVYGEENLTDDNR